MRKYVFLGDSLIYGYGVSPRDNWVYKLKNTLNLNLYNKGIDKNIIETAIDDIDTDKEFENALYLGKKRYERLKNEDPRKAYQKIGNHLAYKGFNYDIIKKVLNKLFNDVDEYSC